MSDWISVKDKVPLDQNDVLIIDDRKRMTVSCYFFCDYRYLWEIRDDQLGLGDVTHWMPLPKPPEE